MKLLITIDGEQGSGKSLIAEMIKERLGGDILILDDGHKFSSKLLKEKIRLYLVVIRTRNKKPSMRG